MDTGFGLVPSARVRYVGYFLDGYAETGALGNFTVGDRDLHILQGRVQLVLPYVTATSRIELYAGLEGRTLLSGQGIDAVLLGQDISFDAGGDDDIGGAFLGLNGAARIAANTEVFGRFEATWEGDDASSVGGNVGLRMRF